MPPAAYVDPCRGHFPHKQASGHCPIQICANNRGVVNGARSATTGSYIPLDICQAIDNSDLRFLNKEDHSADAAFDLEGSAVDDVMAAAQAGVIDGASAIAEFARRIPGAANADERGILTASITGMKAMIDTGSVFKSTELHKGNLLKLWGLAVKRASALGGPLETTVNVDESDLDALATELSGSAKSLLQIRRARGMTAI